MSVQSGMLDSPKSESDILEKIQKRALKIIYSDIPYEACIQKVQIESLKTRRERLSKQFFLQIFNPTIECTTC